MAWRRVALRRQIKENKYSFFSYYVGLSPWLFQSNIYIWTFFVFKDVLCRFQVLLKVSEFLAIGAGDLGLSEHFFSLLKTAKHIINFAFNVTGHFTIEISFFILIKYFMFFLNYLLTQTPVADEAAVIEHWVV